MTLLARRLFTLDQEGFEEWVKPAQRITWKKLKQELDKNLPSDQVKILGETLPIAADQSVNWADVRRKLQELGSDEADLDRLANRAGITRSVAAHLVAEVKQQDSRVKSRGNLRNRLAAAKQAAQQLLSQLRQQDRFVRLEQEIRAINPEVLR